MDEKITVEEFGFDLDARFRALDHTQPSIE
jgi:hypothetical protein